MTALTVLHYLDSHGVDSVGEWLTELRDMQAKVQIIKRLNRLESANFGDHKFCRDGVWELRVDIGPGYRVYYSIVRRKVVLLLCAGNKRTQTRDIDRACKLLLDWHKRVPR